jgi:hypothetical protein
MQNDDSSLAKNIKQVNSYFTRVILDRSANRLTFEFKNDEQREQAETWLKMFNMKYSLEANGSLTIENAIQLLVDRKMVFVGMSFEVLARILLGPPGTYHLDGSPSDLT